jgi:hypothetical protein
MMTNAERLRYLREAKEDYDKTVEAIERIYQIDLRRDGEASSSSKSTKPKKGKKNSNAQKGKLLEAVKDITPELRPKFTILDLVATLEKEGTSAKKPSLRSILIKLVKEGFLEVVEEGSGRRPSIYKVK